MNYLHGQADKPVLSALSDTNISAIRTIVFFFFFFFFLGGGGGGGGLVVSVAQLVEVTDSAVLSGVFEVARSNPALPYKYFQHLLA